MRQIVNLIWSVRRAILLYGVLLLCGWLIGEGLRAYAFPELHTIYQPRINAMFKTVLVVFVIVAAIPFVPGAEIGFALLILFGAQASLLVYLCMVTALIVSYLVARLMPATLLGHCLTWIGCQRASEFVLDVDATEPAERLDRYAALFPKSAGPLILKNRYLMLALVFNLPGNTLIGGGGGLAFLAGMSGLFGLWQYLVVVLCAVAPLPLFFLLMGPV